MATSRSVLLARLHRRNIPREVRIRPVAPSDREDLSTLLYASFRGTVDDEGETAADARTEIEKTFAGTYGRFLPDCSFVIRQSEGLAAACLVTWFEPHQAPLVAFSMTLPAHQRRGFATTLLRASMNALLDRGYAVLTLVVTKENVPAQALYRKLGFLPMPEE